MLLSNQPKHVYYINVSGRPWVAPSAWSLVGVRGSKANPKLLGKVSEAHGDTINMFKCLVQCRAHKKNSINVSYTITTLYFSVEMGSISCLFVSMNRRLLVRRPAEEWILLKGKIPWRWDLTAAQSQVSSRSGVCNSWSLLWYLRCRGGLSRAANQNWRKFYFGLKVGCPFPWPPYLPGTRFLAIAGFIVCLPTYQKEHMPVFSLL